METFTYQRQAGAVATVHYRTRDTQFGDGYSQHLGDGLNNRVEIWPLQFEGGLTAMQDVIDFFDRHAGYKSFYWTPPTSSVPLMYRVANISITSSGAGVYRVAAEFTQVFFTS